MGSFVFCASSGRLTGGSPQLKAEVPHIKLPELPKKIFTFWKGKSEEALARQVALQEIFHFVIAEPTLKYLGPVLSFFSNIPNNKPQSLDRMSSGLVYLNVCETAGWKTSAPMRSIRAYPALQFLPRSKSPYFIVEGAIDRRGEYSVRWLVSSPFFSALICFHPNSVLPRSLSVYLVERKLLSRSLLPTGPQFQRSLCYLPLPFIAGALSAPRCVAADAWIYENWHAACSAMSDTVHPLASSFSGSDNRSETASATATALQGLSLAWGHHQRLRRTQRSAANHREGHPNLPQRRGGVLRLCLCSKATFVVWRTWRRSTSSANEARNISFELPVSGV